MERSAWAAAGGVASSSVPLVSLGLRASADASRRRQRAPARNRELGDDATWTLLVNDRARAKDVAPAVASIVAAQAAKLQAGGPRASEPLGHLAEARDYQRFQSRVCVCVWHERVVLWIRRHAHSPKDLGHPYKASNSRLYRATAHLSEALRVKSWDEYSSRHSFSRKSSEEVFVWHFHVFDLRPSRRALPC